MTSLRRLVTSFVACVLFASSSAIAGNPVLDWNEQVINATRLSRNPPPLAALHIATFHAAIYDTVTSITHSHHGWLNHEPAPANINMDAAIAGAAYTVLTALWSQSTNPHNFQVAYDQALAAIPDGA